MLLFIYWCWTFDVHLLDWGVKRFSGWRSLSSFCCRLSHEPFHFLTFQPGNLIFASGRRGTYKIHALCTGLLDKLNFNNYLFILYYSNYSHFLRIYSNLILIHSYQSLQTILFVDWTDPDTLDFPTVESPINSMYSFVGTQGSDFCGFTKDTGHRWTKRCYLHVICLISSGRLLYTRSAIN